MAIISPSLLSADFLHLERDIKMINDSDAGWLHCDVMDGRFVPNISFGLPIIAAAKKASTLPLDVHLMIVEPEKYFEAFAKAGADHLIVHYEVSNHLHRSLQSIKALGMKAGVAINPHTPVRFLSEVIMEIDIVLIMSVNPGFGGQSFIPQSLKKIAELRQMIEATGATTLIEVDGGVTVENTPSIIAAGADALVAGNTVFSSSDPKNTIHKLSKAAK
ncbi:MAG: ribulose-phosphate 3-epimerase [Chitinophagaceae bacterium]